MNGFPGGFDSLVIGSTGGIGSAVCRALAASPRSGRVVGLSRQSEIDIENEASVADAAERLLADGLSFHLVFDATGVLDIGQTGPEKALSDLDPAVMARILAINAIGPALLLKHFAPLLPRQGRCVFATLSVRVGSIGDNQLGGWYAYRASKAALNQIVRSASIEIARKRPEAVCLALHPGTVETDLSRSRARGRFTHTPDEAAHDLLKVIDCATASQTGSFLAYDGSAIPW